MLVSNCMTKNPITISPEMTVPDAQALMRKEKVSRIPVLDKTNKLVGIITELDLIHAAPSMATTLDVYEMNYLLSKLKVEKVMTRKVLTIPEDTTIEDASRIMVDNNISGLPVVRGDLLVGIITQSDLFKLFIELFGARRAGVRVTVLVPEKPGELALLATAITKEGGNIISFGTFLGDDPSNGRCTLKIEGIERERVVELLTPIVQKIVDIREV
jgi:acetoin utilization protein AcuB